MLINALYGIWLFTGGQLYQATVHLNMKVNIYLFLRIYFFLSMCMNML